jgi:hypothetical protein
MHGDVLIYMVWCVDLFRNNKFQLLICELFTLSDKLRSVLLIATEKILRWLGGLNINNSNYLRALTLTVAWVYIYMKH